MVPIAEARYDAARRAWVVCVCPFCGRRNRHAHGAGADADDPADFLGVRLAHCGGPNLGTYELVDAGEFVLIDVPDELRFASAHAAKISGLSRRVWDREYRGRLEPLTAAELRARGGIDQAANW